jgi:hypothetical protein
MNETSSRFKDFESIIINDNQFEKCLIIQLALAELNITKLLSYLKCNGWSDYKFNQYSMKSQIDEHGTPTTTVIVGYVPPIVKFK